MEGQPLRTVKGSAYDTYYEIVGDPETYSKPNGFGHPVHINYYLTGAISSDGGPLTNASFLSFPIHKLTFVNQLWKCSMRAQHSRSMRSYESNVLQPRLRTYNKELKRILIGYEAFDGFLSLEDQDDFASSGNIPGNPNHYVQELIRSLLLALKSLHRKGVSSSMLHHPCAFVWVGDTLKIWLLDISAEDDDWRDKERDMLTNHIWQLGVMIRTYLLNPALYAHVQFNIQRRFFIQSFWADFGNKTDVLLNMLATHHFLDDDMVNIFMQLAEVQHAIKTGNCSFNVKRLLKELNGKEFRDAVMPTGDWIPEPEFRTPAITYFLQKDAAPGYTFAFAGRLARELIRFSRCLYHHYSDEDVGLTMEEAFGFILSTWPSLISRVHVIIARLSSRQQFQY